MPTDFDPFRGHTEKPKARAQAAPKRAPKKATAKKAAPRKRVAKKAVKGTPKASTVQQSKTSV